MNILAVDIGETHIKLCTERRAEIVKFESGPHVTPSRIISQIVSIARDWKFDRVSLGFSGPVARNLSTREANNLGSGLTTAEFESSFYGKPVRMINDSAMQALGSYRGGSMLLFLGLGTSLGSALVCNGVLPEMKLAHLPWKKGRSDVDIVGVSPYRRKGRKRWAKHVLQLIETLHATLAFDYVALGGREVRLIRKLLNHVALGDSQDTLKRAFMLG